MAYVRVMYNDPKNEDPDKALEKAIAAFKRQVNKEGILKDLRKKECYVPKSIVKRAKLKESIVRQRKKDSRRNRFFSKGA